MSEGFFVCAVLFKHFIRLIFYVSIKIMLISVSKSISQEKNKKKPAYLRRYGHFVKKRF